MRESLRVGVQSRRSSVARAAAVTAAVLGLGVTGVACGGGSSSSSSSTTSSTTAARTASANQWIGQICSNLSSYINGLQTGANNVQSEASNATNLQQAKTSLVNFMNGAVSATNNLVSQIEAAGPAPTRDGAAISQALVGGIQQLGVAFSGAQAQAQALPTDDPQAFENQAKAIGTTLDNAGSQIGNNIKAAIGKYPTDNLDAEFNSNPACQSVK